jgi:hypothetical protein
MNVHLNGLLGRHMARRENDQLGHSRSSANEERIGTFQPAIAEEQSTLRAEGKIVTKTSTPRRFLAR